MYNLKKAYCSQKGYIALMSAVVISVLLIAITVTVGFNEFFTRFNILDSESKERSKSLAEACVDVAILDSAKRIYYGIPKEIPVGPTSADKCMIISSQPAGSETVIKSQAEINKAYTNLKVSIDNWTFSTTSWEECANLEISC